MQSVALVTQPSCLEIRKVYADDNGAIPLYKTNNSNKLDESIISVVGISVYIVMECQGKEDIINHAFVDYWKLTSGDVYLYLL